MEKNKKTSNMDKLLNHKVDIKQIAQLKPMIQTFKKRYMMIKMKIVKKFTKSN